MPSSRHHPWLLRELHGVLAGEWSVLPVDVRLGWIRQCGCGVRPVRDMPRRPIREHAVRGHAADSLLRLHQVWGGILSGAKMQCVTKYRVPAVHQKFGWKLHDLQLHEHVGRGFSSVYYVSFGRIRVHAMQRHGGRDMLGMRDMQRLPSDVCRGPVRWHAGYGVRTLQLCESSWDLSVRRVHNQHQHAVHELHDRALPFWAMALCLLPVFGQRMLRLFLPIHWHVHHTELHG